MHQVANLDDAERAALFRECAARRGVPSPVIIEKDFWVCWILKLLFGLEAPPRLLFKGGTSLSKGYALIDRFSEDVDLAIDRADLGFGGDRDPAGISGTKARQRALDALSKETEAWITGELLAQLRDPAVAGLSQAHTFEIDGLDQQTILFAYPPALQSGEYGGVRYVQPVVRLELGSRSDRTPTEEVEIQSCIAEDFPSEFATPACIVTTLAPVRTFWEKATILHAENHRPSREAIPRAWLRGSRHAYDLVMMARGRVADQALGECLGLLEEVAIHKAAFFSSSWANYAGARPGSLRLVPRGEYLSHLRRDYADMALMFLGPRPTFDELIAELKALERSVNRSR